MMYEKGMVKTSNTVKSTLILTLAAMIWGFAFVAQRSSMEFVGPFFFCGVRSILGGITLLAVLSIQNKISGAKLPASSQTKARPAGEGGGIFTPDRKAMLFGGLVCGLVLFSGSNFQQVGLVFTTASKAGFITTLYIVLVPIFGLFLKHKTHWNTWAGVLMSAIGLYFLCLTESFDIQLGDMIVLFGAAFWATHILVIAHFVTRVDAVKLSCVQFFVCGIASLIVMPFADSSFVAAELTWENVRQTIPSILYTGILSSGVAFTLQAVGQKYAKPSAASIIMSTEAVFGVIGGFLLLNERLTVRELFGCVMMFAAVTVAQLPIGAPKEKASN